MRILRVRHIDDDSKSKGYIKKQSEGHKVEFLKAVEDCKGKRC